MALNPITGAPSALEIMKRSTPSTPAEVQQQPVEETGTQANELNQAQEFADDMSQAAAQFGRVRDLNRKRSESSENRDRILDDDVDTKLDQIFAVIDTNKGSKQQFYQFLRSLFPDPSDLLLVLLELLRSKKIRKAQRKLLEDLIDELEDADNSALMRAGINVALKARVFSKSIAKDPKALRSLYREFIMFEGPSIYIYGDWIDDYDEKQREQLLDFMLQALVADMQSLAPSAINNTEFGPLLEKLGEVRILYSIEETFINKLMKLVISRVKPSIKNDFLHVLVDGVTEPENIKEKLYQLLTVYSNLTLSMRAALIQTMNYAFKALPTGIFISPEMRDELLENLTDIMTDIYNQERRLIHKRRSAKK